jgi:biopolymer transport protein ExbD
MARHKRYDEVEEENAQLDISSLIDVTFLLLIYFLVTSAVQVKETDLAMKLPSAVPSDKQPDIEPMFIRVDGNGVISAGVAPNLEILDSDATSRALPQLNQRLEMYAGAARSANTTPLVQLWVDGGAFTQRVIDVINALAVHGIKSVTFTDLLE